MEAATRYADSNGQSIAFQVHGDGPLDLVLVPGFVSHVELIWEDPALARFLRRLISFSRLILFDRDGTGTAQQWPDYVLDLQHVPTAGLTWAQLVSVFGDFLALFAVFSIVSFRLHGSPAEVAGVSIAYMLPMACVGPAAGVFADRWAPKTTMVASDLVRAILAILLVFCGSVWQIYAVMIALSSVSSFFCTASCRSANLPSARAAGATLAISLIAPFSSPEEMLDSI